MTINETQEGSSLTLAIEGRLDTVTAPELEEVIKNSLEGITSLTVNLEKLDYISSAGLRVVLLATKTMAKQGEMVITGAKEEIMDIFEVTGFVDILNIV